MIFLDSQQMAVITKDKIEVMSLDGRKIENKIEKINLDPISAVKGNYRHFMQKEIHEQARALTDTLAGRIEFNNSNVNLETLKIETVDIKEITGIKIIACGTAAHAGQVGKYLIESIARIPVEVDIASEFRYQRSTGR